MAFTDSEISLSEALQMEKLDGYPSSVSDVETAKLLAQKPTPVYERCRAVLDKSLGDLFLIHAWALMVCFLGVVTTELGKPGNELSALRRSHIRSLIPLIVILVVPTIMLSVWACRKRREPESALWVLCLGYMVAPVSIVGEYHLNAADKLW